jgi:protein gp37
VSANSTIEWTDATWNPIRGCTKVSPGCKHCYAQTFAERFRGVPGHPYEQGFDLRLAPEKLLDPFKWKSPKKVFVNSMSDLFQTRVSAGYIREVVSVMVEADWHVYQVLTKRSERMRAMLADDLQFAGAKENIWWGVSVEDKKHGLSRIEDLRSSSAKVKFLSIEPLLEDLGEIDLSGIHWVIVGGESGPGARALDPSWVKRILRQCRRYNVPFFFKQWGGVNKGKAGRLLSGRTYDEYPTMPMTYRRRNSYRRTNRDEKLVQIAM